jgi:hypothetical protein
VRKRFRFIGLDVHAQTIAVAAAEADGEARSLGVIPNGLEAVRRLSAFIVLCIGVQIVWNGMQALAAEMRSRASAPHAAAARLVERKG